MLFEITGKLDFDINKRPFILCDDHFDIKAFLEFIASALLHWLECCRNRQTKLHCVYGRSNPEMC